MTCAGGGSVQGAGLWILPGAMSDDLAVCCLEWSYYIATAGEMQEFFTPLKQRVRNPVRSG